MSAGQRDYVSGWWYENCVKPVILRESSAGTDFSELFLLWEWHTSVDCALHTVHNSLKWGLPDLLAEKDIMTE
eukprot:19251-Amphidinium_carterae.1